MRAPEPTVILLVAEEGEASDELPRALDRYGFTLHQLTGLRAIEWMRHEPVLPSIILIDWTLPRGDAARFLAQQASDPRYAQVPVVVISDLARMRTVPTLCVSATLARPVRVRTLVDVIGRLCRPSQRGAPADLAHGTSTSNPVVEPPYPTRALSSRSQEMTKPLPGADDDTARNGRGDDRTTPTERSDRTP